MSSEIEFMEYVRWMVVSCGFSGVFTGRTYRRRVAESLVARGLLQRHRLVVCDGDGYAIEPQRTREGYVVTPAGQAWLDREAAG